MNLIVTEDKREHTIVKRGTKEEENKYRNVIKLGSKLGDREDIEGRKGLATITLSKYATIWKDKWKIKQKTRIELYGMMVKSILLYNCGTWGLSQSDQRKLKGFH